MSSAIPAAHGTVQATRLAGVDTTVSLPSVEADGEADVHSRNAEVNKGETSYPLRVWEVGFTITEYGRLNVPTAIEGFP